MCGHSTSIKSSLELKKADTKTTTVFVKIFMTLPLILLPKRRNRRGLSWTGEAAWLPSPGRHQANGTGGKLGNGGTNWLWKEQKGIRMSVSGTVEYLKAGAGNPWAEHVRERGVWLLAANPLVVALVANFGPEDPTGSAKEQRILERCSHSWTGDPYVLYRTLGLDLLM